MTDKKDTLLSLVRELDNFMCEDTPEQFSSENDMYESGDEHAPFFTEAYLYTLLGKSDARRLLARWENLKKEIQAKGRNHE